MKKFAAVSTFILITIILVGSRCSPTPVVPVEPVAQVDEQGTPLEPVAEVPDVNFVAYENKAQGYSILRPNNWYWRHYIDNEISEADVIDYFITDPDSLKGLGSDYLGNIVVQVSSKSLADLTSSLAGLTQQSKQVGGQEATRYEGTSDIGQTTVVYLFGVNNKTFSFTYKDDSEKYLPVFENLVSSFKFN